MEGEDKTIFNAGIAKLKRIDMLKQKIHSSRENKDYERWYYNLCGWREEMSERMKKDEEKEAEKNENNIKEALNTTYEDIKVGCLKIYGIFLSKIEYKYGYSMPDQDSALNALR